MKYTKRHPAVKEKIHDKPDVLIGKKGLTEGVLKEIELLLDKKKVIKVKAHKSLVQTKNDFKHLLDELSSRIDGLRIIDVRGKTAVLALEK